MKIDAEKIEKYKNENGILICIIGVKIIGLLIRFSIL
jgi:hypothetical protein